MSRPSFRLVRLLTLLSPIALAACGGGGGGSQGVRNVAPSVTLALQGPSMTDAEKTTVHGVTSSATGIAEVSASGVLAATSDGFATFGLQLPLASGDNAFDVVARDRSGRTKTVAVPSIRRETPLLRAISASAADPSGQRGLVAGNRTPNEIYFVDTTTGARTLVSGASKGGGTSFGDPLRAAFTADGDSLLVSTINPTGMFLVDATSGDRTALPQAATFVDGIAHDPKRKRAVYTDSFFAAALRALPLNGGSDTVISDGEDGKSPPMSRPGGVVYDPTDDDYLVVDEDTNAPTLLAVSTIDGSRKILSDLLDGVLGPAVALPGPIALDDAKRALFMFVQGTGEIVRVDLTSGTRTLALAADPGLGPLVTFASSLSLDPSSGHLFVTDGTSDHWIECDLKAQRRTTFGEVKVGNGDPLSSSGNSSDPLAFVTPDLARGRLLLGAADAGIDALELATGTRTHLIVGSTTAIDFQQVAIGATANELLVVDTASQAIQRLDATTLAATLVSSGTRGSGPNFGFSTSFRNQLIVDGARERCFVLDSFGSRLLAVDLATGDRSVLAQAGDGRPVPLSFLVGVAFDAATDRVLAIDALRPGVVVIDPATGDRTLFADITIPGMVDVPKGICCVDDATHSLLVVGSVASAGGDVNTVIRVDLDDASREFCSSSADGIGTGPTLFEVSAIGCDGAAGRAFAVDAKLKALFQIDLDSGDRVVIAK